MSDALAADAIALATATGDYAGLADFARMRAVAALAPQPWLLVLAWAEMMAEVA